MTDQQTNQRLLALKQQLLEDLQRGAAASETVALEQNKVGRLSRMDAMQQQAMQNASRDLVRRRLTQIQRAFEALKNGDYGYCETCGEKIPEQRLQVRPEALMCVDCQQNTETA